MASELKYVMLVDVVLIWLLNQLIDYNILKTPNIYEYDMPRPQYRIKCYLITSLQTRGEIDEQTPRQKAFSSIVQILKVWLPLSSLFLGPQHTLKKGPAIINKNQRFQTYPKSLFSSQFEKGSRDSSSTAPYGSSSCLKNNYFSNSNYIRK
jgi:hypothetical protein